MKDPTFQEIRVLFVEDIPADAELVNMALAADGLKFQSVRVDTKESFLSQLRENQPDVILSDHGLPSFSGFAALAFAREMCPEVPFIFVTDAVTPEMEIEKLAPGVADLVPKRNLAGLGPAVRRALTAPAPRRKLSEAERKQVVEKLVSLLAAYEMDGLYIPICSSCRSVRDRDGTWQAPEIYFSKYLDLKFTHGICPKCFPLFR